MAKLDDISRLAGQIEVRKGVWHTMAVVNRMDRGVNSMEAEVAAKNRGAAAEAAPSRQRAGIPSQPLEEWTT